MLMHPTEKPILSLQCSVLQQPTKVAASAPSSFSFSARRAEMELNHALVLEEVTDAHYLSRGDGDDEEALDHRPECDLVAVCIRS